MSETFLPHRMLDDFPKDSYQRYFLVGSRATCSPPPENTDIDVLIQVNNLDRFVDIAEERGFEIGGEEYEKQEKKEMEFCSLKHKSYLEWLKAPVDQAGVDKRNLIVSASSSFIRSFLAASHAAKTLNIQNKTHRKILFDAVQYWTPDNAYVGLSIQEYPLDFENDADIFSARDMAFIHN